MAAPSAMSAKPIGAIAIADLTDLDLHRHPHVDLSAR
jgi:hypothetical protein